MGLSEFYHGLEDAYYNFMDGLENSGIKVYEWFVNPIEDRGLPSMPFFFLGVFLVLGAALFAVLTFAGSPFPGLGGSTLSVAVSVSGPDSSPIDGVQVKLSAGDSVVSARTKNGIANFEAVPYAKTMTVRVDHEGFNQFVKEYSVPSGKSSATFPVSLEAKTAVPSTMVLFVSDDNKFPLSNAQVSFQDPLSGELVYRQTDANGRLSLEVPASSGALTLSVSHDDYNDATQSCLTTQQTCSITLFSSGNNQPPYVSPNPSVQPRWATVRVEVLDKDGNGLSGKVTLYRNDNAETLDSSLVDGQGVARFDNIPLGIDIYAIFDPDSTAYAQHTFDTKTTIEATDYFVQLNPKPSPSPGGTDFSTVSVQAVNSKKEPISGAQVRLYLSQGTLRAVSDTVFADEQGKVVFDIAPTARVYATVWAPGFLPAMTRVMTGGEFTQQILQPVLVGNHGSLNVTVIDDAGVVVSGASVSLLTHDGFALGVPAQDTGLDGMTIFENLPLQRLKANAVYGSQIGSSDITEIGLEPKYLTITLQPATAFVSAKAFDAATQTAISANFTAILSSSGRELGSCESKGPACSIQIPANRNVFLRANSTGYVRLASEEFTVEPGQTFSKSMYLLPASLSNQLSLLSYAVYDQDGRNVTTVDKGRIYSYTVSFNLPSTAQKAGVFLRVGTQTDPAQSPAVFGDYSKPSSAEVVKGARFNPGPSCTDDLGDQSGPIQWIDWTYTQFGANTVKADVFVKPDAKPKDEVVLHFRLFAKAGEVFLRKPDDSRYGGLEKTAELDSCYAQTTTIKLPVIDGKSDCNDRACISTRFASETASAANGLRVDVDKPFNVSIDIRAFTALDSPFLTIKTSPSVQLTGFDFGTLTPISPPSTTINIPLSFFQRTNGTLYAKARLPSSSAKFDFSFADTTGAILDASRFIVAQGTGEFKLAANPIVLEALQDNSLTVTVLSTNGVPVTNAKLSLKETQGSPFEGFPNSPETLQGDGTVGLGKDGVYKFKKLKPHTPGKIAVLVSRDGFAESELELAVSSSEPLEFGQDITNLQLDCKNPTTLTITSRVNAELKVSSSFSAADSACASIRVLGGTSTSTNPTPLPSVLATASATPAPTPAPGTSSATFRVKPGKDTKLLLTPTKNGQCVLSFNSQTLAGQALGVSDAFLAVQCPELGGVTPTPTATASPTPQPGEFCTARGGQCSPLGQACPNGFIPSTYQPNSAFSGGAIGGQSCQSVGGSCVTVGGTFGSQCPAGQSQLNGVCPIGFAASVCCGLAATPPAGASATPAPGQECQAGQQCCVPISQVCQPPNFNFQNIFAKYLGYYLGAQTMSNYPQQVTAASAPVRLMATQNGVVLRDNRNSDSCPESGSGISCTRPIYTLIPYNAMAFSVENQLFNTVDILAQYGNECFEIQEVGKFSGASDLFNDLKQNFQAQANLLTRQTRTYVVTFRPRDKCVKYGIGADGKATIEPIGKGKEGFKVKLKPMGTGVGLNAPDYIVEFKVEGKAAPGSDTLTADYLAFIAMPTGKVTLRGKQGATYEEPAIFANNIQFKQLNVKVSGAGLTDLNVPASNAQAVTLKLTNDTKELMLKIGTATTPATPLSLTTEVKPAPTGLDKYDIVGNVGKTEGLLYCSGATYCTPTQAEEYLEAVKTALNDLAGEYMSKVDTLAYEDPLGIFGGNSAPYERLYQQAMQDALREYMALRQQYEQCKAQGQDPLAQTRAACQQNGVAPIYGYNQNTPGYYNQQGFAGGYNPYGGGIAGGYNPALAGGVNPALAGGAVNPALGGGQVPYNPYQQNFYPGQGYYPGYVNDPNLQSTFGNAFGSGWQQAGCNSDILNAFQYQGQLGAGYFNPFQQQMMQQYAYSRGVYSNNKPVIKDLQPVIALPVKEAGASGGIKVYTIKADLTGASSGDYVEYKSIGSMSSNPLSWQYNYGSASPPSANKPPGEQSVEKKSGFPYLKYNTQTNTYELQNWVGTATATLNTAPVSHDLTHSVPAPAAPSTASPAPSGGGSRTEITPTPPEAPAVADISTAAEQALTITTSTQGLAVFNPVFVKPGPLKITYVNQGRSNRCVGDGIRVFSKFSSGSLVYLQDLSPGTTISFNVDDTYSFLHFSCAPSTTVNLEDYARYALGDVPIRH